MNDEASVEELTRQVNKLYRLGAILVALLIVLVLKLWQQEEQHRLMEYKTSQQKTLLEGKVRLYDLQVKNWKRDRDQLFYRLDKLDGEGGGD